jgi:hypothetical protein
MQFDVNSGVALTINQNVVNPTPDQLGIRATAKTRTSDGQSVYRRQQMPGTTVTLLQAQHPHAFEVKSL